MHFFGVPIYAILLGIILPDIMEPFLRKLTAVQDE